MADVFICHVEEDEALATALAEGLEASGVTTWYYERDSNPGPSYLLQTGEAIDSCTAMVLVISSKALSRPRQMHTEIYQGFEREKAFVPILTDITLVEFQLGQPEWSRMVASATAVRVPEIGVSAIMPRLLRGLRDLGIAAGSADSQQREEAERQQREEAERQQREEAERQQREEAERQQREEAERQQREEAERQQREEAERQQREEAERQQRGEAERQQREEAERQQREEAERQQREEAERQQREEATKSGSRWRFHLSTRVKILGAVGVGVIITSLSIIAIGLNKGDVLDDSPNHPLLDDAVLKGRWNVRLVVRRVDGSAYMGENTLFLFESPQRGDRRTDHWTMESNCTDQPCATSWDSRETPSRFTTLGRDGRTYTASETGSLPCGEDMVPYRRYVELRVTNADDIAGVWTATEVEGEIIVSWKCGGEDVGGILDVSGVSDLQ